MCMYVPYLLNTKPYIRIFPSLTRGTQGFDGSTPSAFSQLFGAGFPACSDSPLEFMRKSFFSAVSFKKRMAETDERWGMDGSTPSAFSCLTEKVSVRGLLYRYLFGIINLPNTLLLLYILHFSPAENGRRIWRAWRNKVPYFASLLLRQLLYRFNSCTLHCDTECLLILFCIFSNLQES